MRTPTLSLLLGVSALLSPLSSVASTSILTLRVPVDASDASMVTRQSGAWMADPTLTVAMASWGTDAPYTTSPFYQTFDESTQTLEMRVQLPSSLLAAPLHVSVNGSALDVPLAIVIDASDTEQTSGSLEREINAVTTLATAMANRRLSTTQNADATTILNGATADSLSFTGALASVAGTIFGSGSGSRPVCDTTGQHAAMSAWNCANAIADRIPNGGSAISTLSGAIQDQVGCELPPGFFQTAPAWTGYIPVYSQITSLGNIVGQCAINLPAALYARLLEHLGNVGIPPEHYGIGSATQRECTASNGQPGRLILSPVGSRCIADEVPPPPFLLSARPVLFESQCGVGYGGLLRRQTDRNDAHAAYACQLHRCARHRERKLLLACRMRRRRRWLASPALIASLHTAVSAAARLIIWHAVGSSVHRRRRAACGRIRERLRQQPVADGAAESNTLYTAFTDRSPRHLDPTASYWNNDTPYTYQIYEPPYGYHYLKRPFELVPKTAAEVVKPHYLDKDGKPLPDDAPGEQRRRERLRRAASSPASSSSRTRPSRRTTRAATATTR